MLGKPLVRVLICLVAKSITLTHCDKLTELGILVKATKIASLGLCRSQETIM